MKSNFRPSPMRVREARLAAHRSDDGVAFLPDPSATDQRGALIKTDVEFFAEEFIASATTGEQVAMDAGDEAVEEELGGPFLDLDDVEGEEDEGDPRI